MHVVWIEQLEKNIGAWLACRGQVVNNKQGGVYIMITSSQHHRKCFKYHAISMQEGIVR